MGRLWRALRGREGATTTAECVGGLLVVVGVAFVSVAAAFVVAGVLLIVGSWAVSR